MGNFDFLQKDKDYNSFSKACIEAEQAIGFSTIMSAICSRRALELAVKWVYQFDTDLRIPYRDNLSSLVHDREFKNIIDPELTSLIRYIIKLGNVAVHNNATISRDEAVLSLRNLFQFIEWIDYCYGTTYLERNFDEQQLPVSMELKLREAPVTVEKMSQEIQGNDLPLTTLKEQQPIEKQKILTANRISASDPATYDFNVDEISESETRRRFIDVDLRLSNWSLHKDAVVEVEVSGMPNKSGKGFVDYVLYGRNGLPLAVVEAKKTIRDPKEGRKQAILYAELLQSETGQMPIIYYTNGFETWMIEDEYPARKVSGFYTQDELQLIIDRRHLRRPLTEININDDISDRLYQKEAIINTCDAFEKNQRAALLVMATGSGKTRTAVSLVDVITQANRVKNILFLADRTSLVRQAFKSFNKLLPNLTLCNLLEDKKNNPQTSRMVFSTYPTILNAIDSMKNEEQEKIFTTGHFDLIIIDESHRSIYQKYGAIFDYFDALLVGLTATPREDVDKNTYELFNLEDGVPTFAYDLEQAVEEEYLVSYRTIETEMKLPKDGIHYDELSEEDQQSFDDIFGDDPLVKDIDGSAINQWLFNSSTVDIVLKELMKKGIKDSSGNELGKTIIFAKNHNHAQIIKDRFDILFPEKGATYAEVIDYSVNYYQQLIDEFSVKNKMPQIAISVDMLDTGIDVPEVVNLVFFKKVRSKIKFWQMIGRGTRLCEDLFGPGLDKDEFLIFDYGNNFDYFRAEEKPGVSLSPLALSQRLFNIKVELIRELQDLQYQEEETIQYRKDLVIELQNKVIDLNEEVFQVRMNLKYVVKYKNVETWNTLSVVEVDELKKFVSPLVLPDKDDELAQRFDLWIYVIELSKLTNKEATTQIKQVMLAAQELQKLGTVPQVRAQHKLIEDIQEIDFWSEISLLKLEEVRKALRELIRFIPKKDQGIYYTTFDDEIISVKEDQTPLLKVNDLKTYKEKVANFIKTQSDQTAVYKLRHNLLLTKQDVQMLEKILWQELGSKEQYQKEFGNKSVTRLVREMSGLDKETVNNLFSAFLSDTNLNASQLQFVRLIVEYVSKNGYLEKQVLMEDPFKTVGSITYLFRDDRQQMRALLGKIDEVNLNAEIIS
ncbi:DEAD/DEAH box helicase [Listeria monocytogenes]|nr:DEAD/DEAH box helicase [Listeria monocytogenes]